MTFTKDSILVKNMGEFSACGNIYIGAGAEVI